MAHDRAAASRAGDRQIRPIVLLLFGGVALLLIMMCLNIANVLLARASGRQRDVAVEALARASPRPARSTVAG